MNLKNTFSNKFVDETLARQEKVLMKASKLKAHANLLQAKEKTQSKNPILRPISTREAAQIPDPPVFQDPSEKPLRRIPSHLSYQAVQESLPVPSSEETPSNKLEITQSLNESTITVNPNIDLKLLFFDEVPPTWAETDD